MRYLNRRTTLKLLGSTVAGGGLIGRVRAGPGNDEAPFDAQRRSVTNATRKYKELSKAVDTGFEIMGPYVPDMGWHVVDFNRIEKADQRGINIRKPQALTYNPEWKLGSVEYIVSLDEEPPDIFNDEDEDLEVSEEHGWHPHHGAQHVFANGNGKQDDRNKLNLGEIQNPNNWIELSDENPAFPPEQSGLEPGDELTADFDHDGDTETRVVDFIIEHGDWWTLHAWLHFENPEGVFALFNHNPNWDQQKAPPHH